MRFIPPTCHALASRTPCALHLKCPIPTSFLIIPPQVFTGIALNFLLDLRSQLEYNLPVSRDTLQDLQIRLATQDHVVPGLLTSTHCHMPHAFLQCWSACLFPDGRGEPPLGNDSAVLTSWSLLLSTEAGPWCAAVNICWQMAEQLWEGTEGNVTPS